MNYADNLLALGPLIVARLAEKLADLEPKVHVLEAADLIGVAEATQFTPAVHVVYQDYSPPESRSDGLAARMEQTWLVVVAVRNMRDLRTGDAARADAGQIASRVLQALMGFKPEPASKPLRLVRGPAAGFRAGFQYLPLAFVGELVLIRN